MGAVEKVMLLILYVIRQNLPGTVEVRLKCGEKSFNWINLAVKNLSFNCFQPLVNRDPSWQVWSYCIKTLGIRLCVTQAIQRRSIPLIEISLRAILTSYKQDLKGHHVLLIHIFQAMIAQTEAEGQWQTVCLVMYQSLLAVKNGYDCIFSFSSSFKKLKIWCTVQSSHSNASIHSKLELIWLIPSLGWAQLEDISHLWSG